MFSKFMSKIGLGVLYDLPYNSFSNLRNVSFTDVYASNIHQIPLFANC